MRTVATHTPNLIDASTQTAKAISYLASHVVGTTLGIAHSSEGDRGRESRDKALDSYLVRVLWSQLRPLDRIYEHRSNHRDGVYLGKRRLLAAVTSDVTKPEPPIRGPGQQRELHALQDPGVVDDEAKVVGAWVSNLPIPSATVSHLIRKTYLNAGRTGEAAKTERSGR
jgi:hypothetical protein